MKKLLYLSDLYNFYVSQNKNVKFSSKDEDTTIVVHIDLPFTYSETQDDDLNLCAPIRICHTEDNINKSYISEKAMKKAIDTAYEMPVLGYIYPDPDNEEQYTFAGHEFYMNDNNEIVYEESPIGVISNSKKLELVYDKDMDKTYLEGIAKIWRTYTKAAEILEREKTFWVSAELCVDELSFDSKKKLLVIDAFRFSGVTILGKSREDGSEIKPGMVGSNITIADFSEQNNSVFSQNEKVIEMLSALSEKIDNLNINHEILKEGGNPVKKEFEEITEELSEEITEEEIKNSPSEEVFDDNDGDGADPDPEDVDYYDDPSDSEEGNDGEEEDPSDDDSGDDDDSSDDDDDDSGNDDSDDDEGIPLGQRDDDDTAGGSKKKYSVSISDGNITKEFSVSLQDKIEAIHTLVNDTYAEADGCYYDCTVYDEDKYVIMSSWWTGDAYKQSFKVKKDVYSLVGDRVRVKAVWCTEDEEKALDNMRANYSSMESELASFKAEPDKEAILAEECYAQIADTDAFKKLAKKETHFSMSVDEVRAEADKQLLEYAKGHKIEFSATEEKKTVGMKKFGNLSKKNTTGKGRYGGMFSK